MEFEKIKENYEFAKRNFEFAEKEFVDVAAYELKAAERRLEIAISAAKEQAATFQPIDLQSDRFPLIGKLKRILLTLTN